MSLWRDFLTNDQRVIHKLKHYFPVYERHFSRFVNTPLTFVEIGVGEGGSLQMWKRYFGPHARIIGIDNRPECKAFEEDQIEVFIGKQTDPVELLMGGITPDIILDDGSHKQSDMITSFSGLYPELSANGMYMVEDICCCYWPEYGGGLRQDHTFIEQAKCLIDDLNASHTRGRIPESGFTRSTLSIHFYDSAIVFERGRHSPNTELRTGH